MLYWPSPQEYVVADRIPVQPKSQFVDVGSGEKLHVWVFKTPEAKSKGVFLQFHGNAQNMTAHFMFMYWVLQEGYDLVTFDYRGYGQSSPTSPSPERTLEDGLRMLEFVRLTFPGKKRIAVGQSLGGAVLLTSLAKAPALDQPDFVILDSSFQSYKQAARFVMKQNWFMWPLIPLSYVAFSDRLAPDCCMKDLPLNQSKVVIHGTEDKTVGVNLGRELFEALPEPKELWIIDGGEHTSAFTRYHGPTYTRKAITVIENGLSKKNP